MNYDANKLITLLKNYTEALAFGFEEEEDQMNDRMKVRCTFCLMQHGAAYLTTKVKLKHVGNKDYLVCQNHDWVKDYHLRRFRYDEQGEEKISSK